MAWEPKFARPLVLDRGALVPVSHRPVRRGKTTLLRLILLSVKPTRGLISLFGEDVAGISNDALTGLRRRMGVVFQDFRLLDHLTTYENVALPLRVQGKDEGGYRRRGGRDAALGRAR
jgi:ABC-type ATPase involved in cell division